MDAQSKQRCFSIAILMGGALLASAADGPGPAVLVTDFQVPSVEEWQWAKKGLSELAVAALGECGVTTVDRDLLSVLRSEQKLTVGIEPEQGGLQLGQMLGATYLLSGIAETTGMSRLRLSGSLTRVETAEQVAAFSTEGEYKKELQALVARWVSGLAKELSPKRHENKTDVQENPIKPEALIFFQQGVDACAANKPALAVGFFLSAYEMDSRLRAAQDWEARAYELGGLSEYAAAVRGQVRDQAKSSTPLPPEASTNAHPQRVVSVLSPVWLGGTNAPPSGMPSLTSLRVAVEAAALAVPDVRLCQTKSLAESLPEQDRQLGFDFEARTTSRYARWLTSDTALFCTLSPRADGNIVAEVGLIDMLTAKNQGRFSASATPSQLPAELANLTKQTLALTPEAARASQRLTATDLKGPISEDDIAQLPDYRSLAIALDSRMRGEKMITACQFLAKNYAQAGLNGLAAKEVGLLLDSAEDPKTGTPDAVAGIYWWLKGYPYSTKNDVCTMHFFKDFIDSAAISNEVSASGCQRIAALRQRIVSDSTARASTFSILYLEAFQAYHESAWETCLVSAKEARAVLDRCERANTKGDPLFDRYLNTDAANMALLRINCLYLEGTALSRQGNRALARLRFDEIQRVEDQAPPIRAYNFLYPNLFYDDDKSHIFFGQCRGINYLRQIINDERHLLAEDALRTACMAELSRRGSGLIAHIQQLQTSKVTSCGDFVARLREIVDVWNQLPPTTHDYCLLSELATTPPDCDISVWPVHERLALADSMTRAYLKVTGVDPVDLSGLRDTASAVPRLQRIYAFYKAMNIGPEGLTWTKRLLDRQADPNFEYEVINQLTDRFANMVRIPTTRSYRPSGSLAQTDAGWRGKLLTATGIKSSTIGLVTAILNDMMDYINDNDMRLEEQKFQSVDAANTRELAAQDIALLQDFFSSRKNRPALAQSEGRLWRKLSQRALMRREYELWHQTVCFAQRCDSSGLPTNVDQFIIRTALLSATQDVLRAAICLREETGASSDPVPASAWYAAGYLCIQEGDYQEALLALQIFRQIYDTYDARPSSSLYAPDSDCSIRWSVLYLEGLALEKLGEKAEAAMRFRQLSQRFGTRRVALSTEGIKTNGGFGFHDCKPLGLLASEALQRLHGFEPGGGL